MDFAVPLKQPPLTANMPPMQPAMPTAPAYPRIGVDTLAGAVVVDLVVAKTIQPVLVLVANVVQKHVSHLAHTSGAPLDESWLAGELQQEVDEHYHSDQQDDRLQ